MSDINRVTAYLKVTAEFYDPEATPETVRACVEQDLTDAGYEVDVDCVFPDEETFCQYMARNYLPPNADMEKVIGMNGKLALDYLEKCWKEHFGKDNKVPCKSDVPDTNVVKTNADHIRSMTDEELGRFCIALTDDGWPYACKNKPECDPVPKDPSDCNECFMNWLKQPYKEET